MEVEMCTAITYKTKDHYFGRNLDYELSYGETVMVTPRNAPLPFRNVPDMKTHYAMIGMGNFTDGYPLYYDATNEKGLSVAGLLFAGNAAYMPEVPEKDNIAPYEFVAWILGQCADIAEAKEKLKTINMADIRFNENLPLSPMHWMFADRESTIVVEPLKEGVKVYDNPVGVLANDPTFDFQLFNLNQYMGLSCEKPENTFAQNLKMNCYSRGMGSFGLPGDLTSISRFVRAAFTSCNSISGDTESESISQFFHILNSVAFPRGCVHMGDGKDEITIYSSCCNIDKGIYYYTTYENNQISAVNMNRENLRGNRVLLYPVIKGQQVRWQN